MPNKTTSLHQAVQSAGIAWLKSTPAGLTDFTFSDRWPEAGKGLPDLAITLLRAGTPEFTWIDEDEIAGVQVGSSNIYTWTFVVAQVELPVQLDVWTTSDAARDDAIARLEVALHASKALTLASYLAAQGNTLQQSLFEIDLVVQCAAPWDQCLAGFLFESPSIDDTPDSVKRREYRATYAGTAFYDFVYVAQAPQIDVVLVREWVTAGAVLVQPGGAPVHILSVTPNGSSQADGT